MSQESEPERTGSAGIAGGIPVQSPNGRFPLLDSLRAMAALAVVVTHTAFVSGAIFRSHFKAILAHFNIGVTLFFLISGFVLYRPFVAARSTGSPPPSVGRYARRRFLRIAPAYWLALTGLAVFPGLQGVFTGNWWVYYGLLQPYPIFHTGPECLKAVQGCGIAPTWSLSIEVAFYLLLPLYAVVIDRASRGAPAQRGRRRELWILMALACASVVLRFWVLDRPHLTWLYGTVLGHFLWFALGMGLAIVSVSVEGRESDGAATQFLRDHPLMLWAGAVTGFLLLSVWVLPVSASPYDMTGTQRVFEHLGFGFVALTLMLPAVFGHEAGGLPRRVLGNSVVRSLGQISYGVFLWHFTVMFELADRGVMHWVPGNPFVSLTLCTLAVTVPLASASYYLVERPIMAAKWPGGRRAQSSTPTPNPPVVRETAKA